MKKFRGLTYLYLIFDFLGSAATWTLFNIFRKKYVESQLYGIDLTFHPDLKFVLGLLFFPLFWISLFGIAGFYQKILRKTRLKEFGMSLGFTIIGSLILFFMLLLDDYIVSYKTYYIILLSLFVLEFVLTYIPRVILTTRIVHNIHNRKIGFPTLIVGNGEKAISTINELNAEKKSQGFKVVGYIKTSEGTDSLSNMLPELGTIKNITQVITDNNIEEVILATDSENTEELKAIFNVLIPLNVSIKATPSMYDILIGRVKMSGILNAPLLSISFELLSPWQANLKELTDYMLSLLAIILLSPLAVVLAITIKLTSKGPIIFKQERIGQYGKPFTLYKFRSMYIDAENGGPALSSKSDNRVTPIGRFMRKTRLDEIPNFYNVFRGDMSLVGPRPERQFYIDQIVKVAPHYIHLQKVKPGITSWGQVKYGYAENVEQMTERLRYDLLYLENMSLFVDFKIMIYTILTVFRGKGV